MKTMCILLAVVLLAALVTTSVGTTGQASAASGSGYALTWSSLDGGGSVSRAETGYALSGSIAQPDAQTWTGEHYQLQGGFWPISFQDKLPNIFLPLVRR